MAAEKRLTHLDEQGKATMVDVGDKADTQASGARGRARLHECPRLWA